MLKDSSDGNMTRGLLTDGERGALRGDEDIPDGTRGSYRSRVKKRFQNRLGKDMQILREHDPELFELVREKVCEQPVDERIEGLQQETQELREKVQQLEKQVDESE